MKERKPNTMRINKHLLTLGFAGVSTLLVGIGILQSSRDINVGIEALRATSQSAAAMVPISEERKYNAALTINANGRQLTTSDLWIGTNSNRESSVTAFEFRNIPLPAKSEIKDAYLEITARTDSKSPIKGELFVIDSAGVQGANITEGLSMLRSLSGGVTYTSDSEWTRSSTVKLTSLLSQIANRAPSSSARFYVVFKGSSDAAFGRRNIFGADAGQSAPKLVLKTERMVDDGKATPIPTPHIITPAPITPRPSSSGVPTARPTTVPTVAPGTPHPSGHSSSGNSMAMGKWAPNRFDTCPVALHDSYSVIGPDGKRYPTWHAPVVTNPATGKTCTFGHEHGRNPSAYQYWDEVRRGFAYDADKNGQISSTELATAGIPFGYVNEQIDAYYANNPSAQAIMRHEDHVGHKIEFANGEGDIAEGTDPFDRNMTGGVVVPVKNTSGGSKWNQSGIRCYHFQKVHQGVSTQDATTNNLHELIVHTKCESSRSEFPSSTSLTATMVSFGAPGEFTRFCNEDRFKIISIGTSATNQFFPGRRGDGMRNIIDRSCVESAFLVPNGQFSSNAYEIWDGATKIYTPEGREIINNGNGAWEVLDAIRYYYPGAPNNIGYHADLCYETLGGRRMRGGVCDSMTNYGSTRGITWDDPRTRFRGLHRGQYINPHIVNNAGGPGVWYTDPFGRNARQQPFPGSVKQQIPSVNTKINFDIDPRIILRRHDSGGNTVHGPN